MSEPSAFRGRCGEVVSGFLRARTLLTAVPVAVWAAMAGAAASFAAGRLGLPSAWLLPIHAVALSPVLGTFALAARRGHLTDGFLESLAVAQGGVGAFSVRHGLLSLVWTVPLAFGLDRAAERLAPAALLAGSASAAEAALVATALLAAVVLAPACVTVAARAESAGECLSGWAWLARERRADLPAFLAALVGALVLLTVSCAALGALLATLASAVSPAAAAAVVVAAWVAPLAAAPVLCGRLAGALAADEQGGGTPAAAERTVSQGVPRTPAPRVESAGESWPGGEAAAWSRAIHPEVAAMAVGSRPRLLPPPVGPAGVPTRRDGEGGVSLVREVARLQERGARDPAGALIALEDLVTRHPTNPAVAAARARLLRANGRTDAAVDEAGRAVRLALAGGAAPIAADVFRAFADDARRLGLEPDLLERLARFLLHSHDFASAAWCWRAHAAASPVQAASERGLAGVIQAAEHEGQLETALRLIDMFLADHGESPLADALRIQREALGRRVGAGPVHA